MLFNWVPAPSHKRLTPFGSFTVKTQNPACCDLVNCAADADQSRSCCRTCPASYRLPTMFPSLLPPHYLVLSVVPFSFLSSAWVLWVPLSSNNSHKTCSRPLISRKCRQQALMELSRRTPCCKEHRALLRKTYGHWRRPWFHVTTQGTVAFKCLLFYFLLLAQGEQREKEQAGGWQRKADTKMRWVDMIKSGCRPWLHSHLHSVLCLGSCAKAAMLS